VEGLAADMRRKLKKAKREKKGCCCDERVFVFSELHERSILLSLQFSQRKAHFYFIMKLMCSFA
jgi:hypothetical protein